MVEDWPGRTLTAGKSVSRNRPLTSFLRSCAGAGPASARSGSMSESRATKRHRMVTNSGDLADDPAVKIPPASTADRGARGSGASFFRLPGQINTQTRDFISRGGTKRSHRLLVASYSGTG